MSLRDLGIRRVSSARELWIRSLSGCCYNPHSKTRRRLRTKTVLSTWPNLWSKWKSMPAQEKAKWYALSARLKEEQLRAVNDAKPFEASTAVGEPEAPVRGSDAPAVSENPANVDAFTVVASAPAPAQILQDLSELSWVDKRSGDVRILHRTRGGGAYRLGSGSYGMCVSLFDVATGEKFCCKLGRKTAEGDNASESLAKENDIMNRCNHPNIMRSFGIVHAADSDYVGLLMPLMACDLRTWLDEFGAAACAGSEGHEAPAVAGAEGSCVYDWQLRILIQLARACAHVHGAGYVHLDIKPANVLVDAHERAPGVPNVCLSDFGISESFRTDGSVKVFAMEVQSAPYRPWDLFHAAGGLVPVRTRYDVWAFACVVYDVGSMHSRLRGRSLFCDVPMRAEWKVVRASRDWRIDECLRQGFRDLVRRCQDPYERRPLQMASVVVELCKMA